MIFNVVFLWIALQVYKKPSAVINFSMQLFVCVSTNFMFTFSLRHDIRYFSCNIYSISDNDRPVVLLVSQQQVAWKCYDVVSVILLLLM